MSEIVRELERKLAEAKRFESQTAWEKWEKEGIEFLDSIIGKCFGYITGQRYMMLFKVKGYKQVGVWGATAKYFEIETEGYFTIHEAISRFSFKAGNGPYGTFTVKDEKKGKTHYSDLEYKGMSLHNSCAVDEHRITKLGAYSEGSEERFSHLKSPLPQRSIRDEMMGLCCFKVPEELYDDARGTALLNAFNTKVLWDKYSDTLKNLERA